MKLKISLLIAAVVMACVLLCFSAGCIGEPSGNNSQENTITITDSMGRVVTVPDDPQRIALCGAGFMRYFVYLNATKNIVCVDYSDSSATTRTNETKPYLIAHPELRKHPNVGGAMDTVDAELLMASNPDILFFAVYNSDAQQIADEIQSKTGIPVVLVATGDYIDKYDEITATLRMIGKILHTENRAEAVIQYFDSTLADIEHRVAGVPDTDRPQSVYVCGISSYGAHGADGTDISYLPFTALKAGNVAGNEKSFTTSGYAKVAKEKILEWDPSIIFVDLGTLRAAGGGAIVELTTDPALSGLSAVKSGEVYMVNPDISSGVNHETSLANAYYVGKILYPDQFADIDPAVKADEIYSFVVGAPVFETLKANMKGLSYTKL